MSNYIAISKENSAFAELPASLALELFNRSKGSFKPIYIKGYGEKSCFELEEGKQYTTSNGLVVIFFKGTRFFPMD